MHQTPRGTERIKTATRPSIKISLHLRFNHFLKVKYNTLRESDFNTNSTQVSAKELVNEVLYVIYDYSLSVTENVP